MAPTLLTSNFEKNKKLYIAHLDDFDLKIWKYNRPPDDVRVQEIAQYIRDEAFVPGIIYAFSDWRGQIYYIYDGAHRLAAITCDPSFKDLEFLLAIHELHTNDVSVIQKEFKNINLAVPVPDLYLDDEQKIQAREASCRLVDAICNKYKKLQSASPRPRKPNFNRDLLLDCVYDVVQASQQWTDAHLWASVQSINTLYKRQCDVSQSFVKKCIQSDCFLFLRGLDDFKRSLSIKLSLDA